VKGDLPVEEINRILTASNRCMRAVALCMVGGGMGWEAIEYWSANGLKSLRSQLSARILPIRVDLPGRKKNRNKKPYYTLLGSDAVDALQAWLEVKPEGDYIFYSAIDTRLNYVAFKTYWLRHLKRLGLTEAKAKKAGDSGRRTGKNPHELRDVFRTRWEKSGASGAVAEFLMGHVGDPLGYNKAQNDESYVRSEWNKASKWLNIVTMDPSKLSQDEVEREVQTQVEKRLREAESRRDAEIQQIKATLEARLREVEFKLHVHESEDDVEILVGHIFEEDAQAALRQLGWSQSMIDAVAKGIEARM
jgi:hypothetical protein